MTLHPLWWFVFVGAVVYDLGWIFFKDGPWWWWRVLGGVATAFAIQFYCQWFAP
jgi:hypothetical protein